MRVDREFTDYAYAGRYDARQILMNHEEEIAEHFSACLRKGERTDVGGIQGSDSWLHEGHRLDGVAIDMWEAVAILEQIPDEKHEADRGNGSRTLAVRRLRLVAHPPMKITLAINLAIWSSKFSNGLVRRRRRARFGKSSLKSCKKTRTARKTDTDGRSRKEPKIMLVAEEYKVVNGTYYDPRTPEEVVRVLERARLNNTRIRIYLSDTETGRSWLEEYDVEGYVGRSMGPVRIPILLHNSRSTGGGGILTHCVVKIRTSTSVLYQHPAFHTGKMEIQPSDLPEYAEIVTVDGSIHARFRKAGQAARWIQKMQ